MLAEQEYNKTPDDKEVLQLLPAVWITEQRQPPPYGEKELVGEGAARPSASPAQPSHWDSVVTPAW